MTKLSPERLLKQLKSDEPSKRRKALETLGTWNPLKALPYLLDIRTEEEDAELRELANKKLRQMGAIIDLSPMGADSWFEQVKDSSPAFETLCDVMGERFVGYALIVGVQISGLTIDQFTPSNTLVEFKLVETQPPRTLRLPDFRRELVGWILGDSPMPDTATLPLDLAQAQQLVGVRYILLAPLHEMQLHEVVLRSTGKSPKASVTMSSDAGEEEIEVNELRHRLNLMVQTEIDAVRDEPFELDFSLVDQAEEAAKANNWDEVLRLIGHWPGPLSMLSRMQMAANLDDEKRGRIGASLGYLARAYRATGRSAWAEELYRLGLQFAGEGAAGAKLYQSLGESMIGEKRFGESIGPLRRALALGAERASVGPSLGLALIRCRRTVAAVAVLESALTEGAAEAEVLPVLQAAYSSLGDAADQYRELHPEWTDDDTLANAEPLNSGLDELIDVADSTLEVAVDSDIEEDNEEPAAVDIQDGDEDETAP